MSGSIATALALHAEYLMIFESGGVESSRAEYAGPILQAAAALSVAVPRTLVSRNHGDTGDMAWVTSV